MGLITRQSYIIRHQPRRTSGFTLLELLIAFAIMSAIVLIVYLGLDSVSKGIDLTRLSAEKMRIQRFLVNHFLTTLNAVYVDPGFIYPEYRFVGVNESGGYGPADSLRFCTSLPMPGANALPGVRRVVTYSFEKSGSGAQQMSSFATDIYGISLNAPQYLVITESPLIPGEEDSFSIDIANLPVNEVRVPLATLDIKYYDPTVNEWKDEWDSQSLQLMPWAVRIIANLFNEYGEVDAVSEETGDIDIFVVLPTCAGVVQPFEDPNHFKDTEIVSKMDSEQVKPSKTKRSPSGTRK